RHTRFSRDWSSDVCSSDLLFVISALGSALAVGPADLIVWRITGGLAIGAASVIAPAYIAEVAPARLRGRLGSLQQLAIVLGIFRSEERRVGKACRYRWAPA